MAHKIFYIFFFSKKDVRVFIFCFDEIWLSLETVRPPPRTLQSIQTTQPSKILFMRLCLKYNYSFMCVCVCKTFYWSTERNTGQPTVSNDDLMISKIHTQFLIKLNFSRCLQARWYIHFLLILSIENLLNKVILCVSRVRHSRRVVKRRELVNNCRFGKRTESE